MAPRREGGREQRKERRERETSTIHLRESTDAMVCFENGAIEQNRVALIRDEREGGRGSWGDLRRSK